MRQYWRWQCLERPVSCPPAAWNHKSYYYSQDIRFYPNKMPQRRRRKGRGAVDEISAKPDPSIYPQSYRHKQLSSLMSVLSRPSPVRQEDGRHRGGVRSRAQGRQHLSGGRHGE